MSIFVFPGQGSQKSGMGKNLYHDKSTAKKIFHQANEILNFDISKVMFEGSEEDLKQTKITQPAVFLQSIITYLTTSDLEPPSATAGHSLGEFTALVAAEVLTFEDGLKLVYKRALAMQYACSLEKSTMAAILGLEDDRIEEVCRKINGVVVPANYNCPGQLVISGSTKAIEEAVIKLTEAGARRALILNVGGAFHSPLMQPAADQFQSAIDQAKFSDPICPVYQNVDGCAVGNAESIKKNLISQLTSPVRWTQTMRNMINDGHRSYIEVGGKVLSSFFRKVDRSLDLTNL